MLIFLCQCEVNIAHLIEKLYCKIVFKPMQKENFNLIILIFKAD